MGSRGKGGYRGGGLVVVGAIGSRSEGVGV